MRLDVFPASGMAILTPNPPPNPTDGGTALRKRIRPRAACTGKVSADRSWLARTCCTCSTVAPFASLLLSNAIILLVRSAARCDSGSQVCYHIDNRPTLQDKQSAISSFRISLSFETCLLSNHIAASANMIRLRSPLPGQPQHVGKRFSHSR